MSLDLQSVSTVEKLMLPAKISKNFQNGTLLMLEITKIPKVEFIIPHNGFRNWQYHKPKLSFFGSCLNAKIA